MSSGVTRHPVHELLPDDVVRRLAATDEGRAKLEEWLRVREQKIRLEREYPLVHGWEPPVWHLVDDLLCAGREVVLDVGALYPVGRKWADPSLAGSEFERRMRERVPGDFRRSGATVGAREVLIQGGNRTGKSRYAARKLVMVLRDKPGARAWASSDTNERSIDQQQPYVYEMLPPEWRQVKKGRGGVGKVVYSQDGGFTENIFVLPNGSQCRFKFYAQKDTSLEGDELDVFWGDELIPMDWVKTIRLRLVDRSGIMILTFTPVKGYTDVVADYEDGAEVLVERPAVLLPDEVVPVVKRCKKGTRHVVWMNPLLDNPFAAHENLREVMRGRDKKYVLERIEGVAQKRFGRLLAGFDRAVHVVRAGDLPSEGTWYMGVDPSRGKPWVMLWALVTKGGSLYVAREWPCPGLYVEGVGDMGEWVVPGKKADGDPGPAQDKLGWGVRRYIEEMERLEAGGVLPGVSALPGVDREHPMLVWERIIDPRAVEEKVHGAERTVNLRELLEEESPKDWEWTAARGIATMNGVDVINDWLYWDERKPLGYGNEPRLYISEECKNLIACIEMWTGQDGDKGASKDFVDVLRYMLLQGPEWVDVKRQSVGYDGSFF